MLNRRLSERQKELGLYLVEKNNQVFLATMRGIARIIARRKGKITSDDIREYHRKHHKAKQIPMPTHPNAWGAVFKTSDWKAVGYTKSKQVSRRGGVIRVWRLKK